MLADHEQYDWMSINCAKTCGTCEEDTAEPTEVTQETGQSVETTEEITEESGYPVNIVPNQYTGFLTKFDRL